MPLLTQSWRGLSQVAPPLELGNAVRGPAAALMSYCQMHDTPAAAVLASLSPCSAGEARRTLQRLGEALEALTDGAIRLAADERGEQVGCA
jgi:predicted ATP-grasp superfamily ATP-dependent carboligase